MHGMQQLPTLLLCAHAYPFLLGSMMFVSTVHFLSHAIHLKKLFTQVSSDTTIPPLQHNTHFHPSFISSLSFENGGFASFAFSASNTQMPFVCCASRSP